MKKNKILIFTGSRAEYGIMRELIKTTTKFFNTNLVVSGSHFKKEYGSTLNEIKKDKVKIFKKINVFKGTSSIEINKTISYGIIEFSKLFKEYNFDALIVCGDRYEILSPSIAATFYKVPIVHFHGGELSFGSYDDTTRHMVTKMASLHFVSHEKYKNRVNQLGENMNNIHCIGAIGYSDNISNEIYSKNEIKEKLRLKFNKFNFLIVFHPETQNMRSKKLLNKTLKAIKTFKNTNFFFTGSGADLYAEDLKKIKKNFIKKNNNSYYFESLGRKMYLSLLKNVDCLIGNSSSAIYEAPIFKVPSVNIGTRQQGRVFSNNIISSEGKSISDIISKIKMARKINRKNIKNPFFKKNPEKNAVKILKKQNFSKLLPKKFFDLI